MSSESLVAVDNADANASATVNNVGTQGNGPNNNNLQGNSGNINNNQQSNNRSIGNYSGLNMRTRVRSVVDDILQLNNGDFHDIAGGSRSRYDDRYDNYRDRDRERDRDRYSDKDSRDDDYDRSSRRKRSNRSKRDANDELYKAFTEYDEVDNQKINSKIDSTIKDLNNLKKEVNRRHERKRKMIVENEVDDDNYENVKTGKKRKNKASSRNKKNSNARAIDDIYPATSKSLRRRGTYATSSRGRQASNNAHRIFTVKNIDTSHMFTNSYLSAQRITGRNNGMHTTKKNSTKQGAYSKTIEYKIKTYGKKSNTTETTPATTSTDRIDTAGSADKKYTVKNTAYFAHRNDGCPNRKCSQKT